MLLNGCTQYASKFGKLSSGNKTIKSQFSFWSQRRALPKNVQTTAKLHSFHMLVKWWSQFSKLGFNNTWTENSQMFKLDLEKAEEPEIKLPTSVVLKKWQNNSRKISTSAWLHESFWLCGSQHTVENSSRDGNTRPPDLPPWKTCMQVKKKLLELSWNNRLAQN